MIFVRLLLWHIPFGVLDTQAVAMARSLDY